MSRRNEGRAAARRRRQAGIVEKKRHPLLWTSVILVTIVAVVLGFQFHDGTGLFKKDAPPTQSISHDQPKTIGKDDLGSPVSASGSAVPANLKAAPAKDAFTPPFKNYRASTYRWHLTSITPSGKLPATVQFTLPLEHKLGKGEYVYVLTNHSHTADGWRVVPIEDVVQPKAGATSVTFQTTELSWFTPFIADLANMVSTLKEAFFDGMTSGIFTGAKPPTCQNEHEARADDYRISSDSKNTMFWCFGVEHGQRIVKVVNNRRYPLEIKTTNLKTLERGKADLDLAQLAGYGNHLILNGGDQATFSVSLSHGSKATINTDVSKLALGLHAVDVIGSAVATVMFKVNPHAIGKASDFIENALHMRDCVSALGDITNMGVFVRQCFDEKLLAESFGVQAALLTPVMLIFSGIGLVQAVLNALGDSKNGRAKYQIVITRPKASPFASYLLPVDSTGRPNHWHVHGMEVYINADGSGNISVGGASSEEATVQYTANSDGSLSGKVLSVHVTGVDPGAYGIMAGDTFRVSHQADSHLLRMHWDRADLQGGNENLCDAYASAHNASPPYAMDCGA